MGRDSGGANALGLGALDRQHRRDKSADLIAVDLSDQDLSPMYDVASHLVGICADRHHVSDVGRRSAGGEAFGTGG